MTQNQKNYPFTDFASIIDVTNVNHRPHPFMVGVKHVTYASQHNGGMLTEEVMRKFPCEVKGCDLPLDQHTSDRVAFVQLKRNCTKDEMQSWLKSLTEEWTTSNSVDGFTFVDTAQHFRVQ